MTLVAHDRPDGKPCKVPFTAGKTCLHCGAKVPREPRRMPVRPVSNDDVKADPEITSEADEISAEEKALAEKNRERVLGLVRKHLTVEDLAKFMVEEMHCKEGSITIGETRRLVILP